MSLAIDLNDVTRVLLADGWHAVKNNSFDLDSYEFVDGEHLIHGGGRSDVCATGFNFVSEGGVVLAGPMTAIVAVERAVK